MICDHLNALAKQPLANTHSLGSNHCTLHFLVAVTVLHVFDVVAALVAHVERD